MYILFFYRCPFPQYFFYINPPKLNVVVRPCLQYMKSLCKMIGIIKEFQPHYKGGTGGTKASHVRQLQPYIKDKWTFPS